MRNKISAADKRLPTSVQSLWYSEERRKRDRINTLAQLNHDDDPDLAEDTATIFKAKESDMPAIATPVSSEQAAAPTIALTGTTARLTIGNANLAGSTAADVNLTGLTLRDANLSNLSIVDADLTGAALANVNLTNVTITDARVDGLTINGVSFGAACSATAARFEAVYPIGNTDVLSLPVKDVRSAVSYYISVLGFELEAIEGETARLRRDAVEIGLAANGADPDQASVYFAVSDVDALRAELIARSVSPSNERIDVYSGKPYRVFFAKEPYGVCFCFGQAAETTD